MNIEMLAENVERELLKKRSPKIIVKEFGIKETVDLDALLKETRPSNAEALVASVVSLANEQYSHYHFHITHVSKSTPKESLEQEYEGSINAITHQIYRSMRQAKDEFSFYSILSLPDSLRQHYNLLFKKTDKGGVQGLLGEALVLAMMHYLKEKHPLTNIEIFQGESGSVEERKGALTIAYKSPGTNFTVREETTGTAGEIDSLMLYRGVPIVFESKTGSPKEKPSKNSNFSQPYVNLKRRMYLAEKLFDARPALMVIRSGDVTEYRHLFKRAFSMTLPFKEQLMMKVNRILNYGDKI